MTNNDARQTQRNLLRAKRRTLTLSQQAQAARNALRHLMHLPLFVHSQHVAIYLANDGELDPQPVAEQLWAMGKHCYLPVLHPLQNRQLSFVEFLPDTPLKPNRYGIPEPEHHHPMPAHLLDMVLVPLVGFDRQGARLGMGGGFYDSTFAFHQHKEGKPHLLGLAHSCQEVDQLETASWDIPLFGVVTDKEVILCR